MADIEELDAVADVRAMRRRDNELVEQKWAARMEEANNSLRDPDAERKLLRALGL